MGLRDLIGLREAGVGPDAVLTDEVEIGRAPPRSDAPLPLRSEMDHTAVEFAVSLRPDGKPLAFVMGPMIGLVAGDRAPPFASSTRVPRRRLPPLAALLLRAPRLVVMADGGTRSAGVDLDSSPLVPGIRPRPDARRSAERAVKEAMRGFELPSRDSADGGHFEPERSPTARPPVEKPDPDADPLWWL